MIYIKKIRIINSYEEYKGVYKIDFEEKCCNEEEIKQCEIEIKSENQKERLINSLEQYYNENQEYVDEEWKEKYLKEENYNEKEIKEKCKIKINDEIIPFSYFYEFKNIGKYKIIYLFNNNLTHCNCLFADCKSLISIDLSNFNTQNVTNMSGMFNCCYSLKKENIIAKDNRILKEFEDK